MPAIFGEIETTEPPHEQFGVRDHARQRIADLMGDNGGNPVGDKTFLEQQILPSHIDISAGATDDSSQFRRIEGGRNKIVGASLQSLGSRRQRIAIGDQNDDRSRIPLPQSTA